MIKSYLHHPNAWLYILILMLINTIVFGYFSTANVSFAITVEDEVLSGGIDNREYYSEIPAEYIEKMYYLRKGSLTEVPARMVEHACQEAYGGEGQYPHEDSSAAIKQQKECRTALMADLEL